MITRTEVNLNKGLKSLYVEANISKKWKKVMKVNKTAGGFSK